MIIAVTDANFAVTVRCASLPALVVFWAPWCLPCESLTTELNTLARAMQGTLLVAMANVAECRSLPVRLGVLLLPTLILFAAGKEVMRITGVPTTSALSDSLAQMGLDLPGVPHAPQDDARVAK